MPKVSKRFPIRFRLQTLAVISTAFIVVFGLVVNEFHREQQKRTAAETIVRLGGNAHRNMRPEHKQTGIVNGYLRVAVGDDYFSEFDRIYLRPESESSAELLRHFPEVAYLGLAGREVTDEFMQRLVEMPRVARVEFTEVSVGQDGLNSLTVFPNLASISLKNCSLHGNCFHAITQLPKLSDISAEGCEISIGNIQFLKSMTRLSFRTCPLTDGHLEGLHAAGHESTLSLFDTQVTEAGILALRESNADWTIHYGEAGQGINQLPDDRRLVQTEKLGFEGPLVSDATLHILQRASSLKSLEFRQCAITQAGLRKLNQLRELDSLSLISIPIVDADLSALSACQALKNVSLAGTKVSGSGLRYLPSEIINLNLSNSAIEDTSLVELSRFRSLEVLMAMNTGITDASVPHLGRLTQLKQLYVGQSKISKVGIDQLRRLLPDCEVFDQ